MVVAVAIVSVALVGSTLAPARPADALPAPVAADVARAVHLLRTTPYRPIDDRAILDGARSALEDVAKRHGPQISIATIEATTSDATMAAALDDAIASAAEAAHAAPTEFAYAAIAGMARAADDRYTQFFTPDQYRLFNQSLDPERISGIGVTIETDALSNSIRLSFVIPGTPADRAGLQAGDILATIDGTPTKGLSLEDASKLLRGKAGTVVRLELRRADEDVRAVSVVRTEVQPPTVEYKMLASGIGYIGVRAFGRLTPSEFDVAMGRVKDAGARAIVLDLRNDGGGYVDSALDITSRFVARKPMLTVEERGVPDTTYHGEGDAAVALPMTILVNQGTASASEITAGALQDNGVGVLVGTRTFGKGVMQTLTELPDGAAIKITTAHYLTPNRHDINLRGIDPDIRVDENRDPRLGDIQRDAQLRAAVDLLQKKIADPSTLRQAQGDRVWL